MAVFGLERSRGRMRLVVGRSAELLASRLWLKVVGVGRSVETASRLWQASRVRRSSSESATLTTSQRSPWPSIASKAAALGTGTGVSSMSLS